MPIYSRKVKNKKNKDGMASYREGNVYDVFFKYNTPEGPKTYAKCGFTDRKEAQEHEAEMRLKLSKPTYSEKAAEVGKKPLREYLIKWLEEYAMPPTYAPVLLLVMHATFGSISILHWVIRLSTQSARLCWTHCIGN